MTAVESRITAFAPVKDWFLNKVRSTSGSGVRRSCATNSPKETAIDANRTMTGRDLQPDPLA
jgi:hypothetical protein